MTWFNESKRHSMSAKGIKTAQRILNFKFGQLQGEKLQRLNELHNKLGKLNPSEYKEWKELRELHLGLKPKKASIEKYMKLVNPDALVTTGKWNVNYTFGGDIPTGKVRFEAFYFDENDRLVKDKDYGKILTKKEAKALALEKGYVQPFSKAMEEKARKYVVRTPIKLFKKTKGIDKRGELVVDSIRENEFNTMQEVVDYLDTLIPGSQRDSTIQVISK